MRILNYLQHAVSLIPVRRLTSLAGALAVLAAVSGCVVYAQPVHVHPYYWR